MTEGLKCQSAEDVINGMKEAWEDARMMMMWIREKMKVNADKHRREENMHWVTEYSSVPNISFRPPLN
jgi:hypothetical protein